MKKTKPKIKVVGVGGAGCNAVSRMAKTKIEGVEFVEALKILAEKAGITLERGDPKLRSEKDRLYEMCELAAEFFTASLKLVSIASFSLYRVSTVRVSSRLNNSDLFFW